MADTILDPRVLDRPNPGTEAGGVCNAPESDYLWVVTGRNRWFDLNGDQFFSW